jgi:hypothetical protein
MIVLLFVGLALRILVRTYQADKETGEALNPLDVCWEGPEKWRTITQAVLIVAAGALLPPEFFKVLAGLEVQGVSLGWFIMIVQHRASEPETTGACEGKEGMTCPATGSRSTATGRSLL